MKIIINEDYNVIDIIISKLAKNGKGAILVNNNFMNNNYQNKLFDSLNVTKIVNIDGIDKLIIFFNNSTKEEYIINYILLKNDDEYIEEYNSTINYKSYNYIVDKLSESPILRNQIFSELIPRNNIMTLGTHMDVIKQVLLEKNNITIVNKFLSNYNKSFDKELRSTFDSNKIILVNHMYENCKKHK